MKKIASLFIVLVFILSCSKQAVEKKAVINCQVAHPEWVQNSVIYEVNIRQHTPEGTFNAFTNDLPRLKELGVDILWLMPVFPIGQVNRKATQNLLAEEIQNPAERAKYLGSYYAISDYKTVNPEFGTIDDFKALVAKAHDLGMFVILDIAANHTAWDHPWIKSNPEYYTRINPDSLPWKKDWMDQHPRYYNMLKELGMTYPIHPNETDWWDTADLNYDNDSLREDMKRIFKFWITEHNIDGYRCDVADWVPADFWDKLRPELDAIKPVFMLAEAENPVHLATAFDMNYAWEFHHIMNRTARGESSANDLKKYFEKEDSIYSKNCLRMNFITNHDENSWNGTEFERLGKGTNTYAVLSFTVPGMPLIYSGQEVGMTKRLRFFQKDTVTIGNPELPEFYKSLIKLKKDNRLFWNGGAGGDMKLLDIENERVFAFQRVAGSEEACVILNLSGEAQEFMVPSGIVGAYSNYFGEQTEVINEGENKTLAPWEYLVLLKK